MDDRHNDEPGREHHSRRAVPDNAPDPVETRDPASRPTPARRRVWLFAVPAVAFLILGIVWMARTEGRHGGAQRAPSQRTIRRDSGAGTSRRSIHERRARASSAT
jgi:hypothetical protein